MRKINKILSIILTVVLFLRIVPAESIARIDFSGILTAFMLRASAQETASGIIDDITWSLEDGLLTLEGSGAIPDYSITLATVENTTHPWREYSAEIKTVVISEGITEIGTYAFAKLTSIEEVQVPSSVVRIGQGAFLGCYDLNRVAIPNQNVQFEECAVGYMNSTEGDPDFAVFGVLGSTAQLYAQQNNLQFFCIHEYENDNIESISTSIEDCVFVASYRCSVCDAEYENSVTYEHDFRLFDSVCTCMEGGSDIYRCTRCGKTQTVTFAARHADVDTDGFCDYCLLPFGGALDLVFVIDVTGSMRDEVNVVKNSIQDYADQLAASNIPYYIALIEYSNDSVNTGKNHYYNVDLDFSNDPQAIQTGIAALSLKSGSNEPVYSAIVNGFDDLHWGVGSARRVILIGDEDPWDEPTSTTGFRYEDALQKLTNENICVYSIASGGSDLAKFRWLAENTGGAYYRSSDAQEFADVLNDIIDSIPDAIHIHDYRETVLAQNTCTQTGLISYLCAGCGRRLNNVVTPALGHEYSSEHIKTDSDSYTVYSCIRCDDSYTIYDPARPVVGFTAQGIVNAVELTWKTAVEESVTGYAIYRSLTEEEGFAELSRVSSRNTCIYTDTSAAVGTTYFYRIRALKGSVEGDLCAPCSSAALPDEEPPVVKSISPASYSTLNKTVTVKANASDNVGIVRYEASYSRDDGETWHTAAVCEGSACSLSFDTTSVPDGIILFRVIAFDAMKNAGGHNRIHVYKIDNTGPAKVEGLDTVVVYPTQLTISWVRPLDEDTDHFVLQEKMDETVTTVSSTIRTLGFNLSGLSPDTEYHYRVMAVDAYGNQGEYSDWLTVKTISDTSAPVVTAQSQNAGAYNTAVTYTATIRDDYAVASVVVQYSTDKRSWTQLDLFAYTTEQKQVNVSKNIDLSGFEEGSLYVRAVGTDKFGNVGDMSADAPFVEYYIDRTAPEAVGTVTASVTDKTVVVRWSACSASDVASYAVYRSQLPDSGYSCVAQNLKSLNYRDSGVARNCNYYYKVIAVDNAGNNGSFGDYCSVRVSSDEIAPSIDSVSPGSGTVGPVNQTVTVSATDNDSLMRLSVACKRAGDTNYAEFKTFDLSGSSKKITFDLPLSEYVDGETVQLCIQCTDAVGLVSQAVYVSYVIDKDAPGISGVRIAAAEGSATLAWSDHGESDLSGFEIFRNDGTYTLVGKRAKNASGEYTLTDHVTRQGVNYRIDAVDKYGNRRSVYTDEVSTQIVLKAIISAPEQLFSESELVFSAEDSISAFDIASYVWQFNDGETAVGSTFSRIFDDPGSYLLTLTVTDVKGNTSTASKNIIVRESVRTGSIKVSVISDSGSPVRNCGVYIDLGQSSQRVLYTSSSGVVTAEIPTGIHEIGAYCDGFLPKSCTVDVSANKTEEVSFTLVEQEIVTGSFDVHEMNFSEIVAAGIDINDPANQQIYKVSVTLIYGEETVPVTYIRSSTEIKEYVIRDSDIQVPHYKYDIKYIPNDANKEIIAVVRLPVKASYLKQFFLATLTVFNNADEEYRLVNCSANISVPSGLTVMSRSPIDTVIRGGSSARYTLVLRGDTPGTYALTAVFSGTLEKFNKNVSASFTSNSFRVYDKNDVALVIEIPKQTVGRFRFNIGLENRRPSAIYYPQIDIDGMVQDITAMFKKSLRENAVCEEDDIVDLGFLSIGSFVRYADGRVQTFEGVGMPVDTLEAGCGVFREFRTINMPADGAEAFFSKAVIECEEGFGGHVEVRFIEDNVVPISEEEYIAEHLRFAQSPEYSIASFDFAGYMHDSVKDSKEYRDLNILSWDLGDAADDLMGKMDDEIAADYISQILQSMTEESRFQLKFMESFTSAVDYVTDICLPDATFTEKNKIQKLLDGTDYDSETNQLLHTCLGRFIASDKLDLAFGAYDTVSDLTDIYCCVADEVEGFRRLSTYISAIKAYRDVSDEIKQNVRATAVKVEDAGLKKALLRYANTDVDEQSYKAELRKMCIHNYIGNVYTFFKAVYGPVIKKQILNCVASTIAVVLPGAQYATVAADVAASAAWIAAARGALSALTSADRQRLALKMLIALADVTAAAGSILAEMKTTLEAEQTIESAKAFDTAFISHKQWQLLAYAAFEDYGNAATDNLIAKYITKKTRENRLNAIADVIAEENRLKGIYCHTLGHELASDCVKVISVACPVDVRLYSPQGELAAQVISNVAEVYDDCVSCCVIGVEKIFAVPANLDYRIEITATGAGTMQYTVFEYSDGTEKREVSFPIQTIEENDVFCGVTGELATEVAETYSLRKNDSETIVADGQTLIRVTGIDLDRNTVALDVGNACRLNAAVQPDGVSDVRWETSDSTVCAVDQEGILTAVASGKAVIYAISLDGGYVDTAAVTVSEHNLSVASVINAAGCLTDGLCSYICETCGEILTEVIPALGHRWSGWTVVRSADCETPGLEQRVCLNNSTHTEEREIAKTDHADRDADGYCDICCIRIIDAPEPGGQVQQTLCVCGNIHTGPFARLITTFHRIIWFFREVFLQV